MRTLTILVVVQTVILLLLFGKIIAIEDEMTPVPVDEKNTSVTDDFANIQSQRYLEDTYLYPSENQLRPIIREELAAQLDVRSGPDIQMDSVIESNPTDIAERRYRRELVAQQLEYHTSVGTISDVDMQKLQAEIAKLDEAGRKEMLSRLSRALNSGGLKGRL